MLTTQHFTTVTLVLSSWLLITDVHSKSCDESLLSICYNQLQPFSLTNNLRLVLRGVTQQRAYLSVQTSIKQGRSQRVAPAMLPLHRIFAEFREFCGLYSTFTECLEVHGAGDCMQADLIGDLSNVISTVARRDRSGGSEPLQPSTGINLIRDFDHYRRLANSFCVETPENVQIHVVRCLAHAFTSLSSALETTSDASNWADIQLKYVDGSPNSLTGTTEDTCRRWLRQSQAPVLNMYFQQDGCGEHLSTATRMSSLLSELTMRTTNATESIASPRFSVCGRHIAPSIFEDIVNETYQSYMSPSFAKSKATHRQRTKQTTSINQVATGKFKGRNKKVTSSSSAYPILKLQPNSLTINTWSGQDGKGKAAYDPTVIIPKTADDDTRVEDNYNDDGGDVLGVSLMMSDAPLTDGRRTNKAASQVSALPNTLAIILTTTAFSLAISHL